MQNEIVDKIEPIADNDERQLVGQFLFFQKIFHFFRFVAVGFAANALDFLDLVRFYRSLDVLEMHVCFLAEIILTTTVLEKFLENIKSSNEMF